MTGCSGSWTTSASRSAFGLPLSSSSSRCRPSPERPTTSSAPAAPAHAPWPSPPCCRCRAGRCAAGDRLVEAVVAGLIIATVDPYDPSLLPYLVTPALSAGLIGGWSLAVITSGATIARAPGPRGRRCESLAGHGVPRRRRPVVTARPGCRTARRVGATRADQLPTTTRATLEATRLLTQLRDLSRELSGGLDAVSLGSTLLDDLRERSRHDPRMGLRLPQPAACPCLLAFGPGVDARARRPTSPPGPSWYAGDRGATGAGVGGPFSTDPTMNGAVIPMRIRDTVGRAGGRRAPRPALDRCRAHRACSSSPTPTRSASTRPCSSTRSAAWRRPRNDNAWPGRSTTALPRRSHPLGYLIDDMTARAPGRSAAPDLPALREELSRIVDRAALLDLRPAPRDRPRRQPHLSAGRPCPPRRRDRRHRRPPRAGRVARSPATGRRVRAAAHRPGGHRQRPQAQPGAQPLGHLPGRRPRCLPPRRGRRPRVAPAARGQLRISRSCRSGRDAGRLHGERHRATWRRH